MSFHFLSWLQRAALPLWADIGIDATSGLFVERLDVHGHPLLDVPRRVMVQARQIFVFAEAHARGWHPDAGALAERAGEAMVRVFQGEDGGWIFSASHNAQPYDRTYDLYAQAFVLLALANLTRLTGSSRWLRLADDTIKFLDARLATPATGGFAEALPRKLGARRQNPHMHLLESMLALDEVSPDGRYRERAASLIQLLEKRFLHGQNHILVEYYDDNLNPLGAPPFAFEPGHHFEWAWLLAKHAAHLGMPQPPNLACRLFKTALQFGFTQGGVLFDEVGGDGHALNHSTRLWPCTEAIRAMTLDFDATPAGVRKARIRHIEDAMNDHFLAPAVPGGWIDHVDVDGRPLARYIPASSLYHIVGAACAKADFDAAHFTDISGSAEPPCSR